MGNPPRPLPVATALLLVPLAACFSPVRRSAARHAEMLHVAHVHSSRLLADGRTRLVSRSEGTYCWVAEDSAWSEGRRDYVRDVKVLALVDVQTGETQELHRFERPPGGDGDGNYTIHSVEGRMALVHQERMSVAGTLIDPGGFLLLDLDTGDLSPQPAGTAGER